MGDARKAGGKAGAFNRKPADRRLVREVTVGQRAPKYWTPMVISEHECKVMEVSTNIRASPTCYNITNHYNVPTYSRFQNHFLGA